MSPTTEQLGKNVTPIVRDYVRSAIQDELTARFNDAERLRAQTASLLREVSILRDEVKARVEKIEERLKTDPSFEITKPKLIRLMREMGME